MMIEQNTNYAYKLKYMDNPTFDKVRDLSTKFYRELPQAFQDELFEALNHGIDILDSEPQMTAYLYAFGKMHQAKLEYAFSKLPNEFLEQPEINIIDYGCGQALGTMCYADFLREKGYEQNVKIITLIEPSEICLKRAALHASVFFPNAEIRTINKTFDELNNEVVFCDDDNPKLHILSNVLDSDFRLETLTKVIQNQLIYYDTWVDDPFFEDIDEYNQFVCVGPYFSNSDNDNRMKRFCSLLNGNSYFYQFFNKYAFNSDKAWTAQILCFWVGQFFSIPTKEDINNATEDNYGVLYSKDGKRLLRCNNYELDSYSIKEGTIVICADAFSRKDYENIYCSLKQITIPNSVADIGPNAFYGCKNLNNITLPKSLKLIESSAFSNCESLQSIIIPNSVRRIGDAAFHGCPSLQHITLPDSIKIIRYHTFCGCSSLEEFIIPESVECILSNPFLGCNKIKLKSKSPHFIVQRGMLILGKSLISYTGEEDCLTIPDSVKTIGEHAFSGCKSLRRIIIPNSVDYIAEYAFSGCLSLSQIAIPNSIRSIGYLVFYNCVSLQKIVIPDSVGYINCDAFLGCSSLKQIIIPKGSKDNFKKMLKEEMWDLLEEE